MLRENLPQASQPAIILVLTLLAAGCSSVPLYSAQNEQAKTAAPIELAPGSTGAKPDITSTLFSAHSAAPKAKSNPTLTMKEAVNAALAKHPLGKVPTTRRQIGEAYREQANTRFAGDPAYGVAYKSDQLNSDLGYREFEANLDMPLWLPGEKQARKKLADSYDTVADADYQLLAWQVAGEVMERAWDLRIAIADAEQAKVQLQSARALESDVKRRVDAGEIARSELLLAQQSTLQASTTLQQTQASVEKARLAWSTYTGFEQLPQDLQQQAKLRKVVEDDHPRHRAGKAYIDQALAKREDMRKQRRENPTLTLFAKRDRGMADETFENSLGVGISMPFGSKASSAPQMAEATAAVVEVTASQQEEERQHMLETLQAGQDVQQAGKALQLATQQHTLAQSRYKLSHRAFELGETDLFLLIRAREEADLSARNVKLSQLELARSQSRLNHINGVMPQ